MISIIMSDYNTKIIYLKQAIESILNQTYQNFELILVDDGSKNNLDELASSYHDSRIKIIHNKKNMGLTYSLNKAIATSTGKYIARMDTDDICLKDRLQEQFDFIKENQYDVIGSKVLEFTDCKELGVYGYQGNLTMKKLMKTKTMVHSTVMGKREIFVKNPYKNCYRSEDFVLWSELLLNNYQIFVMDKVLLKYRINKEDYKKRKFRNRKMEFKYKFIYYTKMNASIFDYLYIFKSILSSILPIFIIRWYRKNFKLRFFYEKI